MCVESTKKMLVFILTRWQPFIPIYNTDTPELTVAQKIHLVKKKNELKYIVGGRSPDSHEPSSL